MDPSAPLILQSPARHDLQPQESQERDLHIDQSAGSRASGDISLQARNGTLHPAASPNWANEPSHYIVSPLGTCSYS